MRAHEQGERQAVLIRARKMRASSGHGPTVGTDRRVRGRRRGTRWMNRCAQEKGVRRLTKGRGAEGGGGGRSLAARPMRAPRSRVR